jgi:tripartite-type tricarboxylate transporter receptor subunit TctC
MKKVKGSALLATIAASVVCITLLLSISVSAQPKGATEYPERVVRWVVPFPPGASNDVVARVIGQKLSQTWGKQVVIDNRSGAGGMLGAEIVAKATPDGYTMLLANPSSNAINFALRSQMSYKPEDFMPVTLLGWSPIMLVTSATFPAKGIQDVIAMAKAKPGQLSAGSSGTGGSSHLALELFKMVAGVDILHVPYKGAAPSITDIMSGQITMMFTTPVTAQPMIQAGKLKTLGIAGSKRLSIYPNIPTSGEQGLAGFDVMIWFGVTVPTGTPRQVVLKLNRDLQEILQAADVKERFAALGLEPQGSTPESFGAFISEDIERMRKVAQAAKIPTN